MSHLRERSLSRTVFCWFKMLDGTKELAHWFEEGMWLLSGDAKLALAATRAASSWNCARLARICWVVVELLSRNSLLCLSCLGEGDVLSEQFLKSLLSGSDFWSSGWSLKVLFWFGALGSFRSEISLASESRDSSSEGVLSSIPGGKKAAFDSWCFLAQFSKLTIPNLRDIFVEARRGEARSERSRRFMDWCVNRFGLRANKKWGWIVVNWLAVFWWNWIVFSRQLMAEIWKNLNLFPVALRDCEEN